MQDKTQGQKKHTTLSGTPGGGNVRFFGATRSYDLLSNLHSPIFP
jgi:hypothetical protein